MLPISGVYLWNSVEKKIIMLAMTNVLWESFGHHFKESFSFIYRYYNNGEKQTNIYDYCTDSRNNSFKEANLLTMHSLQNPIFIYLLLKIF